MGFKIEDKDTGIFFTTRFENGIIVLYEGDPKDEKRLEEFESSSEATKRAKELLVQKRKFWLATKKKR